MLLASIPEEVIPILGIVGSMVFGVSWLIAWLFTERKKIGERERTRREIAAYVAEGTISPTDAERLIEAGRRAEK